MKKKEISRREFGWRVSVAAASLVGVRVLVAAPVADANCAHELRAEQSEVEKFGLTAAQREEVEAKLANIVRKYGERLTQEQRVHLRKILSFNEKMMASVRAFPLENGDAPASVLRTAPL